MQRVLTTVTLLGLLVATAAAFAITEHLKLIRSPVYGTVVSKVVSPVCHCPKGTATVRIRLRHRDRVTVTIVDDHGHKVRTLAADAPLPARLADRFVWDGRTNDGARAPDGVYKPWVHLAHAHRTFRLPNRIVLDTRKPKVLSASIGRPVLFAAPGRTVAIKYSFSEQAHAVVYLGRHRIIRGHPTRMRAKVKWAGALDGRPLRAGTYVLSVAAVDAAGNLTPAGARKRIRVVVRYIEVSPGHLTVRAGRRLTARVGTAAPRYTWRLGRRHGARHGKLLRLRAPTTPGTYRLIVAEHGHYATTVVRVRAK